MEDRTASFINFAGRYAHLAVPIAAVVIMLVLLVPLPPMLLDLFISFNLMFSVILLLVGDAGIVTHDVNLLTETARSSLARTICTRLPMITANWPR